MAKPTYTAFTTREYKDGEKDKTFWLQIGSAFPHKNGKGLNVILDALPVNGRIVLLPPDEKPAE